MASEVIHALVSLQNWGDNKEIKNLLKNDRNAISVFHIIGRYSFVIDANFDNKEQLLEWINRIKSVKMSSGVPVVIKIQTQRILDVYKQKETFSLNDYMKIREKNHFFLKINNPLQDNELIGMLKESPIVSSALHVQGENSFTIEIISDTYEEYRDLLKQIKQSEKIHLFETQEVISVVKYRSRLLDDKGVLSQPDVDIRELYTH